MLVLDDYEENKKNETEEEEIQRLLEEKKKKKEEKKKQKEEKKKQKEEKKKNEQETEKIVDEIVDKKNEEQDKEIISDTKETETKKTINKEEKTNVSKKENLNKKESKSEQPIEKVIIKKEKVKGHKFRNFILFLLFLMLSGVLTLSILYLISPYKLYLNGEKEINVSFGSAYEDEGAILKRFIFVSHKTINVNGTVDTSKIGSYQITYEADSISVTRTVHVIDNEAPTIYFLDDEPLMLNINGEKEIYDDVYAYDLYDGEIEDISYKDNIDINKVGEYEITYSACDSSFNCSEKTKKVFVKDVEAPVITINKGDLTLILGEDKYYEYGATATDNYDKNLGEIKIEGNVDVNTIGEYKIKYSICDSSNNCSEAIRKVTVQKEEIINGKFESHPEIEGTLESILILNNNTMAATISLNYCEGITTASGEYSVNGNTLKLKLDNSWDGINTFKFTILDNNTLRLETDIMACAPRQNEKFTRK